MGTYSNFYYQCFPPNDVIDTECVDREGVQFSLNNHILKLLLLVLRLLLKMLLLQNVWIGEEGVRLSVYIHILILLLPTISDNVLSTLNKIVPSDKSCPSVTFNLCSSCLSKKRSGKTFRRNRTQVRKKKEKHERRK